MPHSSFEQHLETIEPRLERPNSLRLAEDGVYVKDGLQMVFFSWPEILAIVSEDHQSCFMTMKRRVVIRESLKGFEEELRPFGFVRLNRKTIFNLRYVKRFTAGSSPKVISSQGESYAITRRRKVIVKREYEAFLMRDKAAEQASEGKLRSFHSRSLRALDFKDGKLWVDPQSKIKQFLDSNPELKPPQLDMLRMIAQTPQARWLGAWNEHVYSDVRQIVLQAEGSNSIPVLAVYRLLLREETKKLAPGLAQIFAYKRWIQQVALALDYHQAIVILEPNALSMIDATMPREWQELYLDALRFAVATLSRLPNVLVYLDAGHLGWRKPVEIAILLARTGVDFIQGFAVNVSHFVDTLQSHAYGCEISALLGGKAFVIDTSRNGVGIQDPELWCNPPGIGLGPLPCFNPKLRDVDALLWVKPPGESDGSCLVEQPGDGVLWVDRVLELGRRANLQI